MSVLATARSFLFVPADRPERLSKALGSGAGAVIVDLEDAVAPAAKADARSQLIENLACSREGSRVLVRINATGTEWHDDDLAQLRALAPQMLDEPVLLRARALLADLSSRP